MKTHYREVSGQIYTSAGSPPVPIEQEAGWTPETVWTRWPREVLPALVGNRNLVVQPVA